MDNISIELLVSATASAFLVASTQAFHQEIVDGGTKNRIWSFVSGAALVRSVLAPLTILWPAMHITLYSLVFTAFLACVYYIASVGHQNQIYLNHGEEARIQSLPYDLHRNKLIIDVCLFLSRTLDKFLSPFYVLSLVSCIFFGAPLYGSVSLGMYLIHLINQSGYFPTFLQTPFLYLNVFLLSSSTFGLTSWFNISFFLASVGFVAFDYIRCHFWNVDSPTAQFPMADPEKKLTVGFVSEHDPDASEQVVSLINHHRKYQSVHASKESKVQFGLIVDTLLALYVRITGKHISNGVIAVLKKALFHDVLPNGVHVTFNHFYESAALVEKILADAPVVDYDEYLILFDQLDFTSPTFRDSIANQMCLHDKYHELSLSERQTELGLSPETALVDVQIAFLKREMTYYVERLSHPSYKDLNAQQIAILHRYARLILDKMNRSPVALQRDVLLAIAITTGSHCNRIYLETLSSLAEELGYLSNNVHTLREEAMLQAQAARETAFRTYYYKTARLLKEKHPQVFNTVFADLDDYHTYENFVRLFGANFYLRNPTLTLRQRNTNDIYRDRAIYFTLSMFDFKQEKMLFSQAYHSNYLVDQATNPMGKLHGVLIRWCAEHFPSCYKNILYDEDNYLKQGPNITALAEMMLLDLGILELNESYEEISSSAFIQASQDKLRLVVQEEADEYLQTRAKRGADHDGQFFLAFWQRGETRELGEESDAIWDAIKNRVATRLFDEFDMLYTCQQDENFTQLIQSGRFAINLNNIDGHLLFQLWSDSRVTPLRSNSLFSPEVPSTPLLLDAPSLTQ